MQNLKLDKKEIVTIIIYVFCIVELIFIFPFQIKKLSSLGSKVKDFKKKIKEVKRDIKSKNEFINTIEKIKLDIVNLDSKIITAGEISSVLAFISHKAKENMVDLLEISQIQPKLYKKIEKAKIFSLPLILKAQASFHNICRFLNILQQSYYFLEIKKLSIKSTNSPYHEVEFKAVTLLKE